MKKRAIAKVKKCLQLVGGKGKEKTPKRGGRKEPRKGRKPAGLSGLQNSSSAPNKSDSQKGFPHGKPLTGKLHPEPPIVNDNNRTERKPDMSIFAGIDLHSNNTVIGLMDQDGQRIKQLRLPNDIKTILAAIEPYRHQIVEVGVEATYNWYWLVDHLRQAGYAVDLANPAAMQQYSGIKHTDDGTDAFFIAELMRLKILPTGHIYDPKLRPFRDILRRRQSMVQQRTSHILSLKSLYARTTGQTLPQNEVKSLKEEKDIAKLFPHPTDQFIASEHVRLIGHLNESIKSVEKAVEAVADKLPSHKHLLSVPGIGRILGMVISMETGPVSRFADSGQYASYCRCVGTQRESNGKGKGKNNSKCGNPYLSWAFVEAAHFAIRYDDACRKFYERKKAKTNTMVATKALACKLAKAAWHVMTKNEPYDPERVFPFLRPQKTGGKE
jgi:transposase